MQLWTFLHIVSMFAAVSLTIGGSIFALEAGRRRDLGALRAYFRLTGRMEAISTIALGAGIVFGLVAASVGNLNLLAGWLVLAYLLVALALGVGMASAPYFNRLRAALDSSEGELPSVELERMLGSPVPYVLTGFSMVILVVIIADMVFKPTF